MPAPTVTPVQARTLTPFHYHSLAVPSGTATLVAFLADRSMSYALAGAMGALAASTALPKKDYLRDLKACPGFARPSRPASRAFCRPSASSEPRRRGRLSKAPHGCDRHRQSENLALHSGGAARRRL